MTIRAFAISIASLAVVVMAGVKTLSSAVSQAAFPSHLGDNFCAIKKYQESPDFKTKSLTHQVISPFVKKFHKSSLSPNCDSLAKTVFDELIKHELDSLKSLFSVATGSTPPASPSKSEPTIIKDDKDSSFFTSMVKEVFGPNIDAFANIRSRVSQLSQKLQAEPPKYNNAEEMAQAMNDFFWDELKSQPCFLPAAVIGGILVVLGLFMALATPPPTTSTALICLPSKQKPNKFQLAPGFSLESLLGSLKNSEWPSTLNTILKLLGLQLVKPRQPLLLEPSKKSSLQRALAAGKKGRV